MTQLAFDFSPAKDKRVDLDEGPLGIKWRDGNMFMFECKLCGKITSSGISETSHEEGCGHPYAK